MPSDFAAALEAVSQDGCTLASVPKELQADKGIVMVAVRGCGQALQYACEQLHGDREVVLAAVGAPQNGKGLHALFYASCELRADKDVVLAAMDSFGGCVIEY